MTTSDLVSGIRHILVNHHNNTITLEEATRQVRSILRQNHQLFREQKKLTNLKKWATSQKCLGCGILLSEIDDTEKAVLNGTIYCLHCYERRKK